MAFKTIMSPAKDGLYPLRIFDVRVTQGEIVVADTVALLAETAQGQRIAIKCAQAGRVTHIPPEGALLEKRERLLVVETFDDAAQEEAQGGTQEEAPDAGATQATACGQQERVRPAKESTDAAPPPPPPTPDELAIEAPEEAATSAGNTRKSRFGKLAIGGAVVGIACVGLYAFTYTDAFYRLMKTQGPRASASVVSTPTGWMSAPALSSHDTFTYKAADGARFFGVDVDSHGTALLAGRIGTQAILCAFTFDAGDPECSAHFGIPRKPQDNKTSDDRFGDPRHNPKFNSLAEAYETVLGKDTVDDNTTYPDLGFVVQDAFANGDALAGFTPAPSDQPSSFYRYDPASKHMTRLDDLAIEARYVAFGRSDRHVAVLGQEIEDKRQALLLVDRAGNSDTVHIEQKWTRAGGNEILDSQFRTFTQVSLTEGGEAPLRIDLGGETGDGWGGLVFTRIPFEDRDDGVRINTKVKTRTTNAKRLLPEADSDRYVYNPFKLTASAYNPATGATATAAAMAGKLVAPQKYRINSSGETQMTDMRGDVLLTIETADGETHRRIFIRGDNFPGAGLKITRITPLPDGRFVLLLREAGRGYPLSAILIVDDEGAPQRQMHWSGSLHLEDLVLSDNGDLYAAGYTDDQGTEQAVLQRYRAGRF